MARKNPASVLWNSLRLCAKGSEDNRWLRAGGRAVQVPLFGVSRVSGAVIGACSRQRSPGLIQIIPSV